MYRRICWLLCELTGILLSRGEGGRILLRSVIEVLSRPVRVRIGRRLAELRCHDLCHSRPSSRQRCVLNEFRLERSY